MLQYECFRRKARKEFLFKYLHAKRIEGIDPAADKSVIISHVLALWGVNDQGRSPQSGEWHKGHRSLHIVSPSVPPSQQQPQPGLDHEDSCSLPEAPAPSRNTSYSSLCNLDLHSPLTGTRQVRAGQLNSAASFPHIFSYFFPED